MLLIPPIHDNFQELAEIMVGTIDETEGIRIPNILNLGFSYLKMIQESETQQEAK